MSKEDYYLGIANAVAQRSPCIRRKYGAIVVKDDAIVSTGYNGPARGVVNCNEVGCMKDKMNQPHYSSYEMCPAVHAEENAVINAARNGSSVLNGDLYLYGEEFTNGTKVDAYPCSPCKRTLINAGIRRFIMRKADGSLEVIDTKNWIKEDTDNYLKLYLNTP